MNAAAVINGNNHHWFHGIDSCVPEILLNTGNTRTAMIIPIIKERKLYNIDSVRNCLIRLPRLEPTTLRNPTSFARLAERAVDKFKKLIHAKTKMKIAMAANI